ncbi:MAG: molybdenum cofactor guanylyltransferase, partial [Candidatus Rokubacteria bacterium]|nr:molybdenum cofactor guanylyltransferase [Candidatus Rokubacteria bacterium]
VACDMPFLNAGLVRHMAERAGEGDVLLPEAAGELQTLHAVYAKRCLDPMERLLRAGRLKITGFFPEVRVVTLTDAEIARFEEPALAFMNLNTPEDLARARALWAERRRASSPEAAR